MHGTPGVRLLTFTLATFLVMSACGGTSTSELSGPSALRCGVSLAAPSQLPAAGASTSFALDTARECSWSASANADWIQLSPRSGQGSGTISAVASGNPSSQSRTAVISVNESSWTVTQAGAPAPQQAPQAPSSPSGGQPAPSGSSPGGQGGSSGGEPDGGGGSGGNGDGGTGDGGAPAGRGGGRGRGGA